MRFTGNLLVHHLKLPGEQQVPLGSHCRTSLLWWCEQSPVELLWKSSRGFIFFVPSFDSALESAEKSIVIDFTWQEKEVRIQGKEWSKTETERFQQRGERPSAVYVCAGTDKGRQHEPVCNNRLWSVWASQLLRSSTEIKWWHLQARGTGKKKTK